MFNVGSKVAHQICGPHVEKTRYTQSKCVYNDQNQAFDNLNYLKFFSKSLINYSALSILIVRVACDFITAMDVEEVVEEFM